MRKLSIIVFLMFSLLLCGMTQAFSIDVTSPGDTIKGYPDDGDWPDAEAPPYVIDDNAYTKFLHFKGDNETSGFQVTASLGGMIVNEITLVTGNDAPARDPVTVELYGSNDSIDGPYTLIATVAVVDFDQEAEWPRNTKNATPITFDNDVAYDHYQVLFTDLRVFENGCCMQVSEVELLTNVDPVTGWAYKDIDTSGGMSWEVNGTITVRADGADIWETSDSFGYLYRPLIGDGSLEVNLVGVINPSADSKGGPMIRMTLGGGSKHGVTAMTATGIRFIYRLSDGGSSYDALKPGYVPPQKLKIQRLGNTLSSTFFGYWDPTEPPEWLPIGTPQTIMMGTDVFIGIAVCAGDGVLTAVLDNVILTADPVEFPWDMKPEDGAERVSLTPTLSWMSGDNATSHDVYLSTDSADMGAPVNTTAPSYSVTTPLLASTTYYWQVVEQPLDVAGPVFSFETLYDPPWYAGTIRREIWGNMWWDEMVRMVDSARYFEPPDHVDEQTQASSPNIGWNDYGLRLSGHLVPGTSGDYTFWVAADDGAEIWLNTDNDVADPVRICGWYRYCGNVDEHPEQRSAPIYLEAGQKYAINVLLKEGGGGDWVNAYWEGPDSPSRNIISGDYLTTAYAINPKPFMLGRRANITPLEAETLEWTPGKYATSQDVLFGTDPAAMVPIATALPAGTTSLPMPAVASSNTYYWQVNSTDGTDTWIGDVWSFTVSDWSNRDIGYEHYKVQLPGSYSYDPATDITVINASNHELWGEFDTFFYHYTTVKMTRDTGMIQARVLSITPDHWRRGGVMIRETLAATSRKVLMHKTGHDNVRMQTRDGTRWGTWGGPERWGTGFPTWVRLKRNGNQFDGYYSTDGENWIHHGSRNVPMPAGKPVYIGLAQCHHPSAGWGYSTGTFDNFSYTTPVASQSWNLNPPSGATMVDIHTTLTWNPGEGATKHKVYFSSDEAAVVGRDEAVMTILPVETTELYVGPLDLGQVYYWCVDEVINPETPGEVLSFTAEEYRTVEDFESYDVGPEALPGQVFHEGDTLIDAVLPPEGLNYISPVVLVDSIDPGTDCLVSRWDFEGDFTDSAGSNDGTANGGVSLVTGDPERGNVASFDGADGSYVDCGNPADLNFSTNDWAVSAWVKTTVTGKPKGTIYGNGGDDGGGIRYTLCVGESKNNRVTLSVDDDENPPGSTHGKTQTHGGTHVTDGVWHHVLGVREGDRIKIYTDGKLEDNDGIGGSDFDLTGIDQHNVLLGAIWSHSGYIQKFYTGELDDVRVYNCAMTVENARFLADLGPLVKPGYWSPTILHWAMDEGSGDTVNDSSGNGLHGTISSAAWVANGSGSCLDFKDGSYVLNSAAGPYLNNLDELTISLWVKSNVIDTDNGFIMGGDTSSDRWGMRYDKTGGDGGGDDVIKYGVNTTDDNEEDESSEGLQTTDWQHLLMTWESGAGLQLYVNGVLDTPTSDKGPYGGVLTGYTKVLVGKGAKDGDPDESWDGLIDDVWILDRVATEAEIRELSGLGDLKLPDRYTPLLGHYEFNDDYTDSTKNDFDGTPRDGVNIVEGAANFVGNNGSVDIGNDELFNFTGNFAITAWVNLNSWGGGWGNAIVGKRGEWGVGWQLRRFGGDDRFSFTTRGMGNDDYPRSNLAPNMGQWYHLAAIRDGTEKRLYIDGVLDSSQGINSNRVNPCWQKVYIGARSADNDNPEAHFDGLVDEVHIFNSAINLGQIRELAGYTPTPDIGDTWSGRAAATPYLEYLEPAHEGSQSMRVKYTGSGAVTGLQPFRDGKHPHGDNADFSLGQAQALSLWFKGNSGNAPGAMFAQLTTVVPSGHTQRVVYDGDPTDLQNSMWQEWSISLKGLSTGKPFDPALPDEGLPITKIKDVGVGVIAAGHGVLYFDDLRLYPTRCVPRYGPRHDLNGDCVVDRGDIQALANEWLIENPIVEEEWNLAVYWDSRYRTNWAPHGTSVAMRDALSAAGYTVLNADELKTWMDARIADGALSVVVFARDNAPDTVVESYDASCTLRKYLDAGGKVVYYADIPLYDIGHADGSWTNLGMNGQLNILGITTAMRWDSWNTATITPTGTAWGLSQTWSSLRASPSAGLTVLATDDVGYAAAWAKHYVPGDRYRGFVRIIDQASPSVNMDDVIRVAEYIHYLMADLYEDDIVNFLDYADLLNHFGDEAFFPAPGDQL